MKLVNIVRWHQNLHLVITDLPDDRRVASVIPLDTHAAVWLANNDPALGQKELIQAAPNGAALLRPTPCRRS
jgi:hypothetical protein